MNQGSYLMNCVTQSEPPVPVVTIEEQVDPPQPPPGDALVPVELAVEELIENYDRKRGNYATQKAAPSQNLIVCAIFPLIPIFIEMEYPATPGTESHLPKDI